MSEEVEYDLERSLMDLLCLFQMLLYGYLRAPREKTELGRVDVRGVGGELSACLRGEGSRVFRGEGGMNRRWAWVDGKVEVVEEEKKAREKEREEGGARRGLSWLQIDRGRCYRTMVVEGEGLTLRQGAEKGWGVALAKSGFARQSGQHRWVVQLGRVNRRGHVFLGVARRGVGMASFLGNDVRGWGFLLSRDLYHGGSRRRSGFGERVGQGEKIEVVFDSDSGEMRVGKAGSRGGWGVAFRDIWNGMEEGTAELIYPAFSLHHPGDQVRERWLRPVCLSLYLHL